MAGQEPQRMGSPQENKGSPTPHTTQTTEDDGLPTATWAEGSTRMEREDFQDSTKSRDTTKFTEILSDNEKFLAHIKEIDITLDHSPNIFAMTNTLNNANAYRIVDLANMEQTNMNSVKTILKEKLDQGIRPFCVVGL